MTNKIIPYEKSFVTHEKAQYWSDKNELKPNEVSLNSNKKFWFNCNNCNHEFDIAQNISIEIYGAHIVQIINFVKIIVAKNVLKNLLHHTKKHNIGVIKMN